MLKEEGEEKRTCLQSEATWLKCSPCRIHDYIFTVHDSNQFSGCAGSISLCIIITLGALSCEGHSSHASQAGTFKLGVQLCKPAVHITALVRRNKLQRYVVGMITSSVINTNFSSAPAELMILSCSQ